MAYTYIVPREDKHPRVWIANEAAHQHAQKALEFITGNVYHVTDRGGHPMTIYSLSPQGSVRVVVEVD